MKSFLEFLRDDGTGLLILWSLYDRNYDARFLPTHTHNLLRLLKAVVDILSLQNLAQHQARPDSCHKASQVTEIETLDLHCFV